MIFIGQFKEFNQDKDFPSMTEFFCDAPYPGQDKVYNYLINGSIDCASLEVPKDCFTNETIPMEKLGMNDGEFSWFNTLAYYVKKYNLRLPKDFEIKALYA